MKNNLLPKILLTMFFIDPNILINKESQTKNIFCKLLIKSQSQAPSPMQGLQFQFLKGMLKTFSGLNVRYMFPKFQFLKGMLKT